MINTAVSLHSAEQTGSGINAAPSFIQLPTGRLGVGSVTVACHAPHNFRDYLTDKPRICFVEVNRSGFAERFQYFAVFHRSLYGE